MKTTLEQITRETKIEETGTTSARCRYCDKEIDTKGEYYISRDCRLPYCNKYCFDLSTED